MTLPPAPTTPIYTASEVETRTGVSATTLRQWERRYGLPSPLRNASGYRLYSPRDLTCIEFILARQEEGVPVSRAVELARHPFASPGHPAPLPEVAALVAALLQPDHKRAAEILSGAHARLGTEEVMLGIMQPALVK
ncbi:MAG: MerR family transcriptional regulator, partial [Deinococcus sp.]